jgi:hypothetical protein
MGDGQHGWAAAEWALMMRNCFVREEGATLVLASGIPAAWLELGQPMSFGPAPTPHGPVRVEVVPRGAGATVRWERQWRGREPAIEVRVPGAEPVRVAPGHTSCELTLKAAEPVASQGATARPAEARGDPGGAGATAGAGVRR